MTLKMQYIEWFRGAAYSTLKEACQMPGLISWRLAMTLSGSYCLMKLSNIFFPFYAFV
jgi:hypothetical protein